MTTSEAGLADPSGATRKRNELPRARLETHYEFGSGYAKEELDALNMSLEMVSRRYAMTILRWRVLSLAALGLSLTACTSTADPTATREERAAEDPAAMMRVGEAAESAGDWAAAETFYRRASELDPDLAQASLAHARILARQGDMNDALSGLRDAHRRHSDDPSIAAALGRMLIVEKRPEEALKVFDEVLDRQPTSIPLQIGKGVALDMTGRHAEAQQLYGAVLRTDPDNAAARENLQRSQGLQQTPIPGRG